MNGILRTGLLWRRVLAGAGQQPVAVLVQQKYAFIRNYAAQQKVRNTSKVLAAADKGAAGVSKDKVTLRGIDGAVSITSLDEAQKIAKRRGLKLMKETDLDGKSQRPVYKLITIAKIKQEELDATKTTNEQSKSKEATKSDKMLSLNNKIAEHDLQSRLKHIQKWLAKKHKVIVVISGSVSDLATSERIFKQMEDVSGDMGRIVQKRTKGSEIRFQIMPIEAKPEEA